MFFFNRILRLLPWYFDEQHLYWRKLFLFCGENVWLIHSSLWLHGKFNINSTQQNWWAEFLIFDHIRSCYKKDHPIIECLDFDHRLNNSQSRCVYYKVDESQSNRYQLFDVPYFYNSKDPNVSRFVDQIYDELYPRFPPHLREIPIVLEQKRAVQEYSYMDSFKRMKQTNVSVITLSAIVIWHALLIVIVCIWFVIVYVISIQHFQIRGLTVFFLIKIQNVIRMTIRLLDVLSPSMISYTDWIPNDVYVMN